jgi:hypothetical protein
MPRTSSKRLPPLDVLEQNFSYDPDTGRFTRDGSIAGCSRDDGYRVVSVRSEQYLAHRIVWAMHYGRDPGELVIDHINGDPRDNRISNLRAVTQKQNRRNNKTPTNNTSGHTGVTFNSARNKFQAQIHVDGKCKHLGLFADIGDAVKARLNAEAELDYLRRAA